MSDYQPYTGTALPSNQAIPTGLSSLGTREIAMRYRLIADQNPWMAQDQEGMTALALSDTPTDVLLSSVGQHYAMQKGNDLAGRMQQMTEAEQRGLWSHLSLAQQSTLGQMGYKVPDNPNDSSWLGDAMKIAGTIVSPIANGLGKIPGVKTVGGGALEALTWLGNQPGHIYRTIRSMDDFGQVMGAVGAVVGITGAIALAPFTAGGSLAAMGTMMSAGLLGGGALAGAAAFSAITNPGDWGRAFSATWDGEKSFDRPSMRKVNALLDDPRMNGLAQDLADLDLDLVDLARELAGQRDVSMGSQLHKIETLAKKMAAPGTAEYTSAVNAMLNATQDGTFQQAVATLVNGKMSPGRDLADFMPDFVMKPGDKSYSFISGITDAAFTIAVDPTLMLTAGIHEISVARRTMLIPEGASASQLTNAFQEVYQRSSGVRKAHEALASAVAHAERGGIIEASRINPNLRRIYGDLVTEAQRLRDTGAIGSIEEFTVKHLHDYFLDAGNLVPMLKGVGTVSNARGIELLQQSHIAGWTGRMRAEMRALTTGMSDGRTLQRAGDFGLDVQYPLGAQRYLSEHGIVENADRFLSLNPNAYALGKTLASWHIPIMGNPIGKLGDVFTSMTTMALANKMVALTGENAVRDIKALSEMGRYFGLSSGARNAWADAILSADSIGAKAQAVNGYLASMLRMAGIEHTYEGRQILEEFVAKSKQLYGSDGGQMLVNGKLMNVGMFLDQQADFVVLPDLMELAKHTQATHLGRMIGIADLPVLSPMMTKVWKPVVLLRLGFIPRAAGEELAAFMARGGLGSLTQEAGARFLGHLRAFDDAVKKQRNLLPLTQDEQTILARATPLLERVGVNHTADEISLMEKAKSIMATKVMSSAETKLVQTGYMGVLPAHIRPIVKLGSLIGWDEPLKHRFDGYTRWLDRKLSSGIGVQAKLDKKLANFAGQALDAPRNPTAAKILKGIGAPEDAKFIPLPPRVTPATFKLNTALFADSLMFGKPYSVRRMLLGGVHDDLVEAGTEWYARHATTVMRELSARNHGAVEAPWDTTNVVTRVEKDSDGVTREYRMHAIFGERRYVGNASGDLDSYANGVHSRAESVVHDPLNRRAIENHVLRIRPSERITEVDLENVADALHSFGRMSDGTVPAAMVPTKKRAEAIMYEMVGRFDDGHWRQLLVELSREGSDSARIADTLRFYLPLDAEHSLDDVIEALRRGHADMSAEMKLAREERSSELGKLTNQQREMAKLISALEGKGREVLAYARQFDWSDEATWVSQFLRHEIAMGDTSFLSRQKARFAADPWDNLPEPAEGFTRLYRGEPVSKTTTAPAQTSVNPQWNADAADRVGRWFTTKREFADGYGAGGAAVHELVYVDVPTAELEAMSARFDPHYLGPERTPDDIHEDFRHIKILPKEYVPSIASIPNTMRQDRWLYDSLEDAREPILSSLEEAFYDPALQSDSVSRAIRGLHLDEKGQFLDTEFREATVMLYEMPSLDGISIDDLARASARPDIILNNRQLLSNAAIKQLDKNAALVADYGLAHEVAKAKARLFGQEETIITRPRRMRQGREVTDGRPHGLLSPDVDTKVDGETKLWSYPQDAAERHLDAMPDAAVDPVKEWAKTSFDEIRGALGRGERTELYPKVKRGETAEDGAETVSPLMWRWDHDGEWEALSPDRALKPGEAAEIRDTFGKPVIAGDPMFFESRPVPGATPSGVMNELVGPMLEDVWEKWSGRQRLVRKRTSASIASWGAPRQSTDLIPLQRTRIQDVLDLAADDLPTWTIARLYTEKKIGNFEKMVNFGFDRVIGPSIDAIVRTPMAFHAFAQRYISNKRALQWMVDPALQDKATALMHGYNATVHNVDFDPEALAKRVRAIAQYATGDVRAAKWSTNQAMGWLRSHSDGEIDDILVNVMARAPHDLGDFEGVLNAEQQLAHEAYAYAKQVSKMDMAALRPALAQAESPRAFIAMIEQKLEPRALEDVSKLARPANREHIEKDPLLSFIDGQEGAWDAIVALRTNLKHIETVAGDGAALAAISDVVPFLDSHEFKTQFADYGKGFMPFWYAEENFLKRWSRGLANEGPALIRRMQLTYMGLKSAGIVRTDSHGRDWFVYPGSGLLTEALGKVLPGMGALDAGIMFQSPTDQLLPGLNSRFGTPSFNPLVTIPMSVVTAMSPEVAPLERSIVGDFTAQRDIIDMVVPGHLRNLYSAVLADGNSGERMASAQLAAIAYLEAHGQGLPDNANADQIDDFLRTVKEHARVVVIAQAFAGFATPGSPSVVIGDDSGTSAFNVLDEKDAISDEYMTLVRMLGIEDGTARFLELHPKDAPGALVNPIAYTVPKNVSTTGAPLPSTEEALEFYQSNEAYMDAFPNAGPWLLPQRFNSGDRSQYAYDQQTIAGLRNRRTPEEFMRAIKYKEASLEYFTMGEAFDAEIAKATESGNQAEARRLKAERDAQQLMYRSAHPVFAEELTSSDGKQRRERVVAEMRTIVQDPAMPDTPHKEAMQKAMRAFDSFQTQLAMLNTQRTAIARQRIDDLKTAYASYMNELTKANPGIMSFWVTILRPQASL